MNKFEKFASIFVILVVSLTIAFLIYLYIIGAFEKRWLITTAFCVFLIVINIIDLRKRW